jgi:hypothetical protein
VVLLGDVVVVARDGRPEPDARKHPPEHSLQQVQHHLAVEPRMVLRPVEVAPVRRERGRPRQEHREVAILQRLVVVQSSWVITCGSTS